MSTDGMKFTEIVRWILSQFDNINNLSSSTSDKASEASSFANNASASAQTASDKADTAVSAAQTATIKASEASEKAQLASDKADVSVSAAQTATTKAKEASDSATAAAQSLETLILTINQTLAINDAASSATSTYSSAKIESLYSALITELNNLKTILSADDVNLDTLQEVINAIKSDEGLITALTTAKVGVADIVDALTSTATDKPLSAAQGKVLKTLIDTNTTKLSKLWTMGATLTAAATTSIGGAWDSVHISGTTTITSFGNGTTGEKKHVIFDGALILTNGASLILPSGANITTAVGDIAEFICESGNVWRCISYSRANVNAIVANDNSLAIETTSSPVFGLLYNATDDLYKRVGKNINSLTIDGFNEFSAWRSPTAERQNDADTASPSPLTAWLDSSANLPYSSIKRYVIDNTGAEVKAYNADSYTHADQTGVTASQQVMVKIPAFYHVQARIVYGGKTYMLFAVANSPFTLDAITDLGFASPTITMWNPTTGVSSGTVSGNTITAALHPAFVTNAGGTLTKRYYGAFNAVSGRSICGSGVKATGTITRTAARTSIQGFGTGFTQIDWFLRSALDILVIVERGSFYMERGGASMANKWEGYSWNTSAGSYDQDNGKTLSLLNKTGVILDGSNRTIANSWRGIENYHSALWNWVDGVNLTSNVVYLAKKGAAYDDSSTTTNGYFSSGITVPSGASASYISDLGAGSFIPTAISGGSATTKMTDCAWTGSTALFVGGNLYYPSTSGVCAWASNYAASASGWNIVARPAY